MVKEIKITLSDKTFYSLVVVGMIVLFGVGVYAYGTTAPSAFGHSIEELDAPDNCEGKALQYRGDNFMPRWSCADLSEGGGSYWNKEPNTNNIQYNNGKIGVDIPSGPGGTTSQIYSELSVGGVGDSDYVGYFEGDVYIDNVLKLKPHYLPQPSCSNDDDEGKIYFMSSTNKLQVCICTVGGCSWRKIQFEN
ncbi:hypothetical protein ACFL0X_02065 [Nanoarchaeota archaeon]